MSSATPQELSFLNWMNQPYQRTEVPKTHAYGSPWNRPYKTTAAVPPTFYPIATSRSPLISTPFLDSSADEALSPACFSPYQTTSPYLNQHNYYHHHRDHQHADIAVGQYIDQGTMNTVGKGKPIFTGDPMELLIDKSKAVSASPAFFASDDITTPLFGPISSFDSDRQHNHQHQEQQYSGTVSRDHAFAMDWPCYNERDGFLFHKLERITETETPTSSSTGYYEQQNGYQNQHERNDSAASSPTKDQQKPTDQSQSASSTTTTTENHNKRSNKPTLKDNNNKRRRKNSNASFSSDSSESDHNKRRITTTTKTDENEKRHGCPICRRKFSRRYNLNTHIRTHNANRIKEFSCDVCASSFDRKHDRDRHLESVHLGKKSYKCLVCKAAFCRRDALSRHTLKFHHDA